MWAAVNEMRPCDGGGGGVPVPCNCLVKDKQSLTSRSPRSMKRLVEVDKVSPTVHGGRCCLAMLEKVKRPQSMYTERTVQAPDQSVFFLSM